MNLQPLLPLDVLDSDSKMRGIQQVLDHERENWKVCAESAVVELAKRRSTFTADDVRIVCAELGDPHHPNVWGALMKTLQVRGVLVHTGRYTPSERPEAHRRMVPVWKSQVFLPRQQASKRVRELSLGDDEGLGTCEAPDCREQFEPYRKNQRFCSAICRARAWDARHPRV